MRSECSDVADMVGKTPVKVERGRNWDNDALIFTMSDGTVYRMYHDQDCCECVFIEDICGELEWLVGKPLNISECVVGDGAEPLGWKPDSSRDSYTWTFYKFGGMGGFVTVRWLGESNGYYGEGVSCYKEVPDVAD